ncbi:RNA polymerase sigma factor [Dictyobacter aurantiacus]|uniref:RNA polymerase sigma factor RpoE n=1 Tax=Dictyobacter aurantiacus TaxID=1936993 RepID=A0A401ZK14_9CHLR|nr:RNA polymerase sigma factor [Dictyobacter aurantiacus]GCE07172.1 RNA polymerase sigma factor RpoE [Dictyobacter aurantiacus]
MPLNADELALVRRTLDGDQDAFGALILIYERPLLTYIYSMLRDWEGAHDVAQETFIAAYYALPRWKPPEDRSTKKGSRATAAGDEWGNANLHPLAPWLYRIATNKALNSLKKRAHQQASLSQISAGSETDDDTPEEHYLVRELLREALGSLSEEDAMCIVLRFAFDERYSEIALKFHASEEAIRKRIARGLVALRSSYARMTERRALL